jgi:hypothetical protein
MAKAEHTSDARVLVGIDISKNRHEVLIAVPGKTRRRRMTVLNTADDYRRLTDVLRDFDLPVTIGFEATGNYHRALMYALGSAGFDLKLVSSVALARTREALHNSWDKNDPKDAQVILHMLQIGAVQVFHDPLVAGTCDIQELSKTYEMVARAKTELWHRILTHYLPLYFPEADRFHRSSRGDWFLAFLEAFPSPHMITAMDKDAFVAAAWPVIGRRVSKAALLADIYQTSKTSVGLPVAPDSDAIRMFRLVLAQGRNLIQQRNAIEGRAAELLGEHPRLSTPALDPGHWTHQCTCHLGRGGRPAPLPPSSPVHEVLWHGSGDCAVRSVPWPKQDIEVRQRPLAPNALDCSPGRRAEACQQLPRQVRTLHRAGPAQPRSASQGLYRHCREDGPHHSRRGQIRRTLSPLLRGGEPRRKDLSHTGPWRRMTRPRR